MLKRCIIPALAAICLLIAQSLPTLACGGPLSPNQSIRLQNAATLLAWHDGIEHYMTNFTYTGKANNFGWVLPLPAEPSKIEEGDPDVFSTLYDETHKTDHTFDWFNDLFHRGYSGANP
ncbi:MAG: DUF2330 domain-containing protein, partial [Ktedonobacteraceae bacterium]|nr:DUF2330 domain-containing protein [Ktedonobacteraceae bacterium]